MPWFKVSIRSTTSVIAIASIDFGATFLTKLNDAAISLPSRARPAMPPACLDGELLRPEVGDPCYPADKIRSVVGQESSRIRRPITWRFVDLTQGLFES
jgi:hypothetical protein